MEEIDKSIDLTQINLFLRKELNRAAQKASMVDIATSVLHNIGNVLNSINTSISVVSDNIKDSRVSDLLMLTELLLEHQDDIQHYLSEDPKGKHVLKYLKVLSDNYIKDNESLLLEIQSLGDNIGYIKNIITMQQATNGIQGTYEEISISDLIEDSLLLNKISYERSNIEIIRDFRLKDRVTIDRVNVFQVIINLIKNAIDALSDKEDSRRHIIILTQLKNKHEFIIKVTDNGIGIAKKHLDKIFTYGFTTKKTGHGFGLHAGLHASKEMKGTLSVESKGLGQGAIFTLTLPIRP